MHSPSRPASPRIERPDLARSILGCTPPGPELDFTSGMPTVSVIIPTYNRGPVLEQAVESVLAQSFQDFEILVVDDGSSDDTASRMARFGDRVRYLPQVNAGASIARNRGILAARGGFVAFLDSDDLFLPQHLEQSLRFLGEESDIDFTFADIEKFNAGGVILPSFFKGKRVERIPYTERGEGRRIFTRSIFPELIAGNFIPTPTLVLRRECFARVGIFDPRYRFLNDAEMYLRLARVYRGGCFTGIAARVRVGDDNLTNSKWNVTRGRVKLQLLRDLSGGGIPLDAVAEAVWSEERATVHFNLAYDLLLAGDPGAARPHILASLRLTPMRPKAYKLLALSLLPPALVAKARGDSGRPQ
jgi:hypothetical protein